MKRQIRFGVFETNSSSMHSLVMMTKEDFEKFKSGEMVWYEDQVSTKENLVQKLKEKSWYKNKSDEEILEMINEDARDYDNYNDDKETFYSEFVTKSGETIVSLGYYGYDG
jgi:hypothetical protein